MAEHDRQPRRPVSIHAPARGATSSARWPSSASARFQSTLPRGERPIQATDTSTSPQFQSTLPRGERQWPVVLQCGLDGVSIHAPARGATHDGRRRRRGKCFNPRSRAGSDQLHTVMATRPRAFQSTLPRGERRPTPAVSSAASAVSIHAPARGATSCSSAWSASTSRFNPRSRAGSDSLADAAQVRSQRVSIHAPARGATGVNSRQSMPWLVSIHAPARGATAPSRALLEVSPVSIHAPARGATACWPRSAPSRCSFNPRSRAGSDPLGTAEAGLH